MLDELGPKYSKHDLRLPGSTRRTFAQLRGGHSPFLQSYLHRLDETTSEACLQCNSETHSTGHLFRWNANPTTLTPQALWESQSRPPLSKPQTTDTRRAKLREPRQQQQQHSYLKVFFKSQARRLVILCCGHPALLSKTSEIIFNRFNYPDCPEEEKAYNLKKKTIDPFFRKYRDGSWQTF